MALGSDALEAKVRARLWSSLSPNIANLLGISLGELQQLTFRHIEPWQVLVLARQFGIRE